MSAPSLTEHLPTIKTVCPYDKATKHPFLTAAGEGTLPLPRLALWLAQDRLYAAHGYPRFIGRLIAAIPYSSEHATLSKEEKQNARTLQVLVICLQNVVREVGFFDDLGTAHGFNVNGWKERKGTRDYLAEMARVSSEGDLFDGLVFLWAMEKVCLDYYRATHTTFSYAPGLPRLLASRRQARPAEGQLCRSYTRTIQELDMRRVCSLRERHRRARRCV